MIFDECHRSQFGDMHAEIVRSFQQYHLFGFTGTPIFADNAGSHGNPHRRTTQQAFGDKLHTYTIVDAINDKNVLPFRIDYINTIRTASGIRDKQVSAIDTERALLDPERIRQVVEYIREHFDQKTKRQVSYRHQVLANVADVIADRGRGKVQELRQSRRQRGFNSLFATASIDAAKRYYTEFTTQQESSPSTSGSRWGSSTATRPTRRSRTACWTTKPSRPTGWIKARATSWKRRSPTTTPCSARATTPRLRSSRITTRTCRSASRTASWTS